MAKRGRRFAGMTRWAASRDPILQRYGVGALARLAGGGAAGFEAVRGVGGLAALVAALTCADPQTQCFAAGALGARAGLGAPAAAPPDAEAVAVAAHTLPPCVTRAASLLAAPAAAVACADADAGAPTPMLRHAALCKPWGSRFWREWCDAACRALLGRSEPAGRDGARLWWEEPRDSGMRCSQAVRARRCGAAPGRQAGGGGRRGGRRGGGGRRRGAPGDDAARGRAGAALGLGRAPLPATELQRRWLSHT